FPNLEGQPLAAEEGANRRFENCSGSREDDLDPGIGRNRSLVDLFPPKLGDVGGDEPEYVVQPRRLDPDSPIATREEVSDAHAAGDARVVGNPVAVDVDRREAVLDRLVELGEGPQIWQTLADHRATFATSRNGERPFPQSVGTLVPDPRYLDGAGAARRLETGAVHPDELERQAPIALEEHDGTDHVHPAVDGSFAGLVGDPGGDARREITLRLDPHLQFASAGKLAEEKAPLVVGGGGTDLLTRQHPRGGADDRGPGEILQPSHDGAPGEGGLDGHVVPIRRRPVVSTRGEEAQQQHARDRLAHDRPHGSASSVTDGMSKRSPLVFKSTLSRCVKTSLAPSGISTGKRKYNFRPIGWKGDSKSRTAKMSLPSS